MGCSESSMLNDIENLLKLDKLSVVESRQLEMLVSGFMDTKLPESHNSGLEQICSSRFENGDGSVNLSNELSDAAIIEAIRKAIRRCKGASFIVTTHPESFASNA